MAQSSVAGWTILYEVSNVTLTGATLFQARFAVSAGADLLSVSIRRLPGTIPAGFSTAHVVRPDGSIIEGRPDLWHMAPVDGGCPSVLPGSWACGQWTLVDPEPGRYEIRLVAGGSVQVGILARALTGV